MHNMNGTTSMKRAAYLIIFPPILIGAVVVLTLLLLSGSVDHPRGDMTSGNASVTPAVRDLERVPIHEGARIVASGFQEYAGNVLVYSVPEDIFKVTDFYNQALPQFGWTYADDHPNELRYILDHTHCYCSHFYYIEEDPTGVRTWNRAVTIDVLNDNSVSLTPKGGHSSVEIVVSRYPVITHVPIYRGAEEVATTLDEVPRRTSPSITSTHTLTTTYRTKATLAELEAFYAEYAKEHGYDLYFGDDDGDDTLTLTYGAGQLAGHHTSITMRLDVRAIREPQGWTHVTVYSKQSEIGPIL
jgi:hypothetical protein